MHSETGIQKQLVDFLSGVKYAETPDKEDIERTEFAHNTNSFGCEHHFGDLDSYQKRRPNASMHHHTTIQMLKSTKVEKAV